MFLEDITKGTKDEGSESMLGANDTNYQNN
jgi:hypothetical protein